MHRLSYVKQTDLPPTIQHANLSLKNPSESNKSHKLLQALSTSSNSLLAAAPLASSISVTSSLNSSRQLPSTINHSISWSTTTGYAKTDAQRVARTVSLMNSNIRTRSSTVLEDQIEQITKRLNQLEKEDLTFDSVYKQEYIELKNRLKFLEEQINKS